MTEVQISQDILPVLRHYLARIDHYLALDDIDRYLPHRLAENVFSAGQHFATAQGMALRALYPVIDQQVPKLGVDGADRLSLSARSQDIRGLLLATDWDAQPCVDQVAHRAGFAELSQSPADYLRLFLLPNFIFHVASGHAALLNAGMKVGKADFDGFHDYPAGFSWL